MSRRKIRNKKKAFRLVSPQNSTQGFEMDNPIFPNSPVVRKVNSDDFESARTYIMSHKLLPWNFVFDGSPECMELVNESSNTLTSGSSSDKEIFRAIIILGHAPCQLAIDTLNKSTKMPNPFGKVAKHALDECLSICKTPPPGYLSGYSRLFN